MGRRLKKRETMIISRILDDLGFKSYAEYLLGSRLDKVLKSQEDKKTKSLIIMGDVAAFILQNLWKAEDNIDALIKSYLGVNQEYVENMDSDEYDSILLDCLLTRLPKVITDAIDVSNVKKKISEAMGSIGQKIENQTNTPES
jgi:hypothetical protein